MFMSRQAIYSPDALKYLRKVPANYSRAIRAKLEGLAAGADQ